MNGIERSDLACEITEGGKTLCEGAEWKTREAAGFAISELIISTKEAAEKLAKLPNLYVDCSSSLPYINNEVANKIVHIYGADKVLFGTDYPMWSPSDELERFFKIGLTEEENKKIFSENAKKLFGI